VRGMEFARHGQLSPRVLSKLLNPTVTLNMFDSPT